MSEIIEYRHDTMTHELRIDGRHLIEKKQKNLIHTDGNDKTLILVHIRSIDDKSYKVTEMVTGEDEAHERQVETDMTEDEVKQFEEDWTNLWNRMLTPLTALDDQCLIKKHSVQVKFNSI